MLKSAILRQYNTDDFLSVINNLLGGGGPIVEIETGIYLCPHHNFGNDILNQKEDYFDFENLSSYGVSDNIEQVKEKYSKWLNNKDLNFCISFTLVSKNEQSETGGWRWHKWGNYIGTKKPKHEYLFNEDDSINEVYCFHIYQILD